MGLWLITVDGPHKAYSAGIALSPLSLLLSETSGIHIAVVSSSGNGNELDLLSEI